LFAAFGAPVIASVPDTRPPPVGAPPARVGGVSVFAAPGSAGAATHALGHGSDGPFPARKPPCVRAWMGRVCSPLTRSLPRLWWAAQDAASRANCAGASVWSAVRGASFAEVRYGVTLHTASQQLPDPGDPPAAVQRSAEDFVRHFVTAAHWVASVQGVVASRQSPASPVPPVTKPAFLPQAEHGAPLDGPPAVPRQLAARDRVPLRGLWRPREAKFHHCRPVAMGGTVGHWLL